jgi:hypothetical protein
VSKQRYNNDNAKKKVGLDDEFCDPANWSNLTKLSFRGVFVGKKQGK